MMKKILLFTIFIFYGGAISILMILFTLRHFYEQKNIDSLKTVHVKKTETGFRLIRNGKPYYIKGAAGNTNFFELAKIGGNTVRLYDTLNLQDNLDIAAKNGLAVIVDIPLPAYGYYNYRDESENKIVKQKVRELVNKFKNHSALLMWNLGNELKYPKFVWKDLIRENKSKTRFIRNFNQLIDIVKEEDTNHPVSTSKWNIELIHYVSFKFFSPGIDIVSFNVFGDTKGIYQKIAKFSFLFGAAPFYISELGSDGWWMNESRYTAWMAPVEQSSEKKAEQINLRYHLIEENKNCVGSLLFYWGNKYECTHTWFSYFYEEYKSEMLFEIERLWKQTEQPPEFVGLEYMLINGKGSYDNIVLNPNELQESELFLNLKTIDSTRIKWEIYPDVWYQGFNEEKYNTKKLDPPVPLKTFFKTDKNKATFFTPDKEGPYRIFAYVFDKNGYFATVNTPFYVLNHK